MLEVFKSSKTKSVTDPSAVAVLTEPKTPTTISVPKAPNVFSKLEIPIFNCRSRSFKLKTPHDENIPAENSKLGKSEVVTHSRKKRKFSMHETPKYVSYLENVSNIE